jgi:hypothetical protein
MDVISRAKLSSVVVAPTEHIVVDVKGGDVTTPHLDVNDRFLEMGFSFGVIITSIEQWCERLQETNEPWQALIRFQRPVVGPCAHRPAPVKYFMALVDQCNIRLIARHYKHQI